MKKLAFLLAALMLLSALCVSAGALTGENYAWFAGNNNDALPKNEHIGGDTDGDGKGGLRDGISPLPLLRGRPLLFCFAFSYRPGRACRGHHDCRR